MPPATRSSGPTKADKQQYLQGKSVTDFPGLGCGHCPLISPPLRFLSPIAGNGWLEISAGTDGVGSGCIRICQGEKSDAASPADLGEIFLVPLTHIEQISLLPTALVDDSQKSDQVVRVIIVPTAATGSSPLARKYPKIIQFNWDKRTDEEGSGATLVDFKALITEQLAPSNKSVLEYSVKGKEKPWLKVSATLEGDDIKSEAGTLWFLPTGILWLGATTIFLPFESLADGIMLIFIRDLSDSAAKRSNSHSAMKFLCRASEPFYAKTEGKKDPKFVGFGDIRDLSAKDQIHSYGNKHKLQIMNLEQAFYNYKDRSPATGWVPLMG